MLNVSVRISLLSLVVVAVGGGSLLAESRRVPECYFVQTVYEGNCPPLEQQLEKCAHVNLGCPAVAEAVKCNFVSPNNHQISCCYNGYETGCQNPPE